MGINHSSEKDPSKQDKNLRFYKNEIKSSPWPGHTIEEMLGWYGNYSKLENNHSYIQWLFPIPESSAFNPYAQPLREHEAKAIIDDAVACGRVLMAYQMMLDFYGMRLVCENSGRVTRCKNWKERYQHLNSSIHNYRRITRIIQSLGELGYERYQVPWVTFLIEESIVNRVLPNLNGGCMRHWLDAIKDDSEREQMRKNYRELFKKPEPDHSVRNNVAERENKEDMDVGNVDINISGTNAVDPPGNNDAKLRDANTPDIPNVPTGENISETNDLQTFDNSAGAACDIANKVPYVAADSGKESAIGKEEQHNKSSELNGSDVKVATKDSEVSKETCNGPCLVESTSVDFGEAKADAINTTFNAMYN